MERIGSKEQQALSDLRWNVSMSQDIDYLESNGYCDTIEKGLEVLEKYRQLEKKIGCPLDVRCKIVPRVLIYSDDGSDWTVQTVLGEYFWASCNTEYSNVNFKWKDYKVTWWTKKDRSE